MVKLKDCQYYFIMNFKEMDLAVEGKKAVCFIVLEDEATRKVLKISLSNIYTFLSAFRVEEFSDLIVEPSSAKCFISDETDKIEFISPFRQPDDIRKSEYIRCTEVER